MGPPYGIGMSYRKTIWAHAMVSVAAIHEHNGPAHCIGRGCRKTVWAHTIASVVATKKHNGPVHRLRKGLSESSSGPHNFIASYHPQA